MKLIPYTLTHEGKKRRLYEQVRRNERFLKHIKIHDDEGRRRRINYWNGHKIVRWIQVNIGDDADADRSSPVIRLRAKNKSFNLLRSIRNLFSLRTRF